MTEHFCSTLKVINICKKIGVVLMEERNKMPVTHWYIFHKFFGVDNECPSGAKEEKAVQ